MEDFLVFPEYLPVLIVMIPVVVLVIIHFMRTDTAVTTWFRKDEVRFSLPGLKAVFRGLGLLLLIVGLLSPYWGRTEQRINKLGREVYILVDVSASMLAEDIKPNRLVKVKKELKKMTSELKGDKIGIIVFTTQAYVQCPLTTDTKAVNLFIDLVGTDQFASTGTNFRAALSTALERFKTEKSARKTTRSVVIISDGEDFGDNYTSVSDRLQKNDIKVFPVGIGTYEGSRVPNIRRGKKVGYKKTKDGGDAISQLNDETLKALADNFNTRYTKIDKQIANLDQVTEQIKLLSASVLEKKDKLANVNRYQLFLLPGLILLFLSWFWNPVRSRKAREFIPIGNRMKNPEQ